MVELTAGCRKRSSVSCHTEESTLALTLDLHSWLISSSSRSIARELSINANAASVVCETMRWGHRCGRRSASATSKLVILRSGEVTNLATDLYRGRSPQCAATADDVVIGYAMRLTRSDVVRC